MEGRDLVAMICKAVQSDPEEEAEQQGLLDAWCTPPPRPDPGTKPGTGSAGLR